MRLYFENNWGKRKLIGEPKDEKESNLMMMAFLNQYNYHAPYTRFWKNEEKETYIDVGSHSEFFVLVDE